MYYFYVAVSQIAVNNGNIRPVWQSRSIVTFSYCLLVSVAFIEVYLWPNYFITTVLINNVINLRSGRHVNSF